MSSAELARQTGLAPSTISKLVGQLHARGIVDKGVEVVRDIVSGRPPKLIGLTPRAGVVAGIDLGHQHLRVAVADSSGRILAERSSHRDIDINLQPVMRTLQAAASVVAAMLRDLDISPSAVRGIGMGVPAPVDSASGSVASPRILRGWHGLPIVDLMGRALGSQLGRENIEVFLENDANLCVLAEVTRGVGRDRKHVLFVKASAGIGAGLFLDGRLYRGSIGGAGEFGHIPFPIADIGQVDATGESVPEERMELCGLCGQLCLEALASGRAIVRRLSQSQPGAVGEMLSASAIVQRARRHVELALERGDAPSHAEIQRAALYLGVALSGLINVLDPELVILGGTLASAGNLYLDPIRGEVSRRTVCRKGEDLIVESALKEKAEVRGAIQLALERTEAPGIIDLGVIDLTKT